MQGDKRYDLFLNCMSNILIYLHLINVMQINIWIDSKLIQFKKITFGIENLYDWKDNCDKNSVHHPIQSLAWEKNCRLENLDTRLKIILFTFYSS